MVPVCMLSATARLTWLALLMRSGLPALTLAVLSNGGDVTAAVSPDGVYSLQTPLCAAGVGLTSDTAHTTQLSQVVALLDKSKQAQEAIFSQYKEQSGVRMAVEAAVMWNFIYVPAEAGPFAPVSRGWSFAPGAISTDWNYVIFDWDNIFAAYMFGALGEPAAKASAYSSLIQVIRSKTKNGFIGNYAAGGAKSQDRSEEIIGAKVLLSLYNQYKEEWIVELLYDDLLDWLTWALQHRTLPPLNLITQGSDNITGVDGQRQPDGAMCHVQGGRYEQADNGVVYDCPGSDPV